MLKRAETLRNITNKHLNLQFSTFKKNQKELDIADGILYTVKAASEWQKRDGMGA